jgi:hypothetical protein
VLGEDLSDTRSTYSHPINDAGPKSLTGAGREEGRSTIRCHVTSLKRQPVGNQSVYVRNPLHSFRANTRAPLQKFAHTHTPKKSFATQSPRKGPFAALPRNDAVGHKRTLRAAANSVHSMNSTVMGRPGAAGLTGVVPVLPITSLCDSAQNLATAKRLLLQEAHNAHCALDP